MSSSDNHDHANDQREEAEKQLERQNNAKRLMEQNIEQLTMDTAEKQVMIMSMLIIIMIMIILIILLIIMLMMIICIVVFAW